MNKRVYVIGLDNGNVRSIITEDLIHLGSILEDEDWFGKKIKGEKVIKIFR